MNVIDIENQIASELIASGIRKESVVLVHSSLRSMGYVPGGPETVIRGFLKATGSGGTLLMPALSYESVTEIAPVFDVLTTPSNVGLIPEYFRLRPGTLRSVNPTHSVCGLGPLARELLSEHHLDVTPCGAHSPFKLLAQHHGQIVFLGCGLKPNTSMHAIEEIVEPPYLFGSTIAYSVTLVDGSNINIHNRRHNFKGWIQRYDRVENILGEEGLRRGKVLDATVYIVESPALWTKALNVLRNDPYAFIEKGKG